MRFIFPRLHSALSVVVIAACAFGAQKAEAGWYKTLTGNETPKQIRQIAPNGLSMRPKPAPTSSLPAVSEAYIDRQGNVYGRSSNTTQRVVGKATISRNQRGEAYWESGSLMPVRAPQYDRRPNGGTSLGQPTPKRPVRPSSGDIWLQQVRNEAKQQQVRRNLQQRQFQQRLDRQMEQFRQDQFQMQQQMQRLFAD